MSKNKLILLNRWRLVLGQYADQGLEGQFESEKASFGYKDMDELLNFLYQQEYNGRDVRQEGSLDDSQLTVVSWINKVHKLFPKETIEKLENHALEKYQMTALLTDKRVLEKLEPNINLLKQILSFKGMMSKEVLATARGIIERVVDELRKKLESRMRRSIMGRRDRNRSTSFKCAKNFDFKKTIARNLKHFDKERNQIVLQNIWFHSNMQRHNPWNIVVCVDESGSMLENVIHSAIMAGIFAKMPVLSVKLVIFDTNVVDLSEYVDDPVETLMSVQLGGGTDIGK
ncbi:MAG: VWA domain-containing protein, partial [Deferribacteraceae bacterium]|nr:VWA domain-containing protein [Deferribacteraceae bacterium]